jgi:hypothetical protein
MLLPSIGISALKSVAFIVVVGKSNWGAERPQISDQVPMIRFRPAVPPTDSLVASADGVGRVMSNEVSSLPLSS